MSSSFKVYKDEWNGKDASEFISITEKVLLPVLQKDIYLNVPHGVSTIINLSDTYFKINIWSSPTTSKQTTPSRMYDLKVNCRDESFSGSDLGIGIYDENDYCVAELFQNTLFIHHDICHDANQDEFKLFKKILTEVAKLYPNKLEELSENAKNVTEHQKNKLIDDITACICSDMITRQKNCEKEMTSYEKNIKTHKDEISELITKRDRNTAGLAQLLQNEGTTEDSYGQDFDNILAHPQVINLEIDPVDNKINIWTEIIYCTDHRSDRVYEIGAFKITIHLGAEKISYINLTRQVNGYECNMQAPHIFPNYEPCLGYDFEEHILRLFMAKQVAPLVYEAMRFIEHVNTDDAAGSRINNWPEVDPVTKVPLEELAKIHV